MISAIFKLMLALPLGLAGFLAGFDPAATTLDLVTPWAYGFIGASLPFILPLILRRLFGNLFSPKIADEVTAPTEKGQQ